MRLRSLLVGRLLIAAESLILTAPMFGRRNRLSAVLVIVFALSLAAVTPDAATAADPQSVGAVAVGDELFWDGEYVGDVRGNVACVTDGPKPTCWEYALEVKEPGTRLRVAVDTSTRADFWVLSVFDPDGLEYADGNAPLLGLTESQFVREIFVDDPPPGRWIVRVLANDVEDWAFRLRAALEGAPAAEPDVLSPDLRAWLPYEFGFTAPSNPQAGSAPDRQNPPGPSGKSCHQDEAPATYCLRFSAGVHNIGDGPLYLRFDEDDRAFQRVYLSDDTPANYSNNAFMEFEAGTAEFHASHGHRHFSDMVLYELFQVVDLSESPPYAQGQRLEAVDDGGKHGWCACADQGMGEWDRFTQDPATSIRHEGAGTMGFGKGWGDLYRWQRPGQFVPYDRVTDSHDTMRAGLYVVRVTADPNDRIAETRENNNDGYAYIRVVDGTPPAGDRVVICERGFGKSPWDPSKQVFAEPFWWQLRRASQAPGVGDPGC